MTTTTLTSADIDALEPLLATALQPLPDALDRAMRALAMARSVADGAQEADKPSSDTDATSESAAAECEDAVVPVVDLSAVDALANAMLLKLRSNARKGHWADIPFADLFSMLSEEVRELDGALLDLLCNDGASSKAAEAVLMECADVANFCAMIADNAARYCEMATAPAAPANQPPRYPGVAWCACRPTPRYAQRKSGSWGYLWYAGGWTIRGYPKGKCRVCGTELQDGTVKEADPAAK